MKSQKKKPKRSLWSPVKVNTKQEKETDERIAVLVTNLSLLELRLEGGAGALSPSGYAYVAYTQNF